MINAAAIATVTTGSHNDAAARLNDETQQWHLGRLLGQRSRWRPANRFAATSRMGADDLAPAEQRLLGVNLLWAGFSAADVQAYVGPANRHPREATEADWQTVARSDKIENWYPLPLGVNWLDFGHPSRPAPFDCGSRSVIDEAKSHPHMRGNTRGGRRVWLGEFMALSPLGDADLKSVVAPPPVAADALHPPIPVRFHLDEPKFVTLAIDDADGRRVRNLVSETWFPAGDNVVWWDGTNDLLRDTDAARHGIYRIPARTCRAGRVPSPRPGAQADRLAFRILDLHRWRPGLDNCRSSRRLAGQSLAAEQRAVRSGQQGPRRQAARVLGKLCQRRD